MFSKLERNTDKEKALCFLLRVIQASSKCLLSFIFHGLLGKLKELFSSRDKGYCAIGSSYSEDSLSIPTKILCTVLENVAPEILVKCEQDCFDLVGRVNKYFIGRDPR
jgi:hypothetical protein